MQIEIDGNVLTTKQMVHEYIQETLQFPNYYGKNLDALWDMLMTYPMGLSIVLFHKDALITHLGDYGNLLIQLFRDVQLTNKNITFIEK